MRYERPCPGRGAARARGARSSTATHPRYWVVEAEIHHDGARARALERQVLPARATRPSRPERTRTWPDRWKASASSSSALWVAGPSAGAVLADWGAEVVKIEPPDGDPFRGLYLIAAGAELPANPPFELDNRGKRSVVLDLAHGGGAARSRTRLLERADVFITNMRPAALARLGARLAARWRRATRASSTGCVTGYGERGPDADRPSYDIGAFWSRAGIAAALTPPGGDPPFQRGAMGDHTAGMTLAGGISAALLARERTGRGQLVTHVAAARRASTCSAGTPTPRCASASRRRR